MKKWCSWFGSLKSLIGIPWSPLEDALESNGGADRFDTIDALGIGGAGKQRRLVQGTKLPGGGKNTYLAIDFGGSGSEIASPEDCEENA